MVKSFINYSRCLAKKVEFYYKFIIIRKNLLYYTSYIDYLNHALSVKGSGTFLKSKFNSIIF